MITIKRLEIAKEAFRDAEKAYKRSNGKHRAETRHIMVAAKREYENLRMAA